MTEYAARSDAPTSSQESASLGHRVSPDDPGRGRRGAEWLPLPAGEHTLAVLHAVWEDRADLLRWKASVFALDAAAPAPEIAAIRREAWAYQVAAQRLVSVGTRAGPWLLPYLRRRVAEPDVSGAVHRILAEELATVLGNLGYGGSREPERRREEGTV